MGHCGEYSNGLLVATIENHELRETIRAKCTRGSIITYYGANTLISFLDKYKYYDSVDRFLYEMIHLKLIKSLSMFPPAIGVANLSSVIWHDRKWHETNTINSTLKDLSNYTTENNASIAE